MDTADRHFGWTSLTVAVAVMRLTGSVPGAGDLSASRDPAAWREGARS